MRAATALAGGGGGARPCRETNTRLIGLGRRIVQVDRGEAGQEIARLPVGRQQEGYIQICHRGGV